MQVKVKLAKEGDNVADVYLVGSDGFLLPATEVTGRLASPDERTPARAVELTPAEAGHFVASRMSVRTVGDGFCTSRSAAQPLMPL